MEADICFNMWKAFQLWAQTWEPYWSSPLTLRKKQLISTFSRRLKYSFNGWVHPCYKRTYFFTPVKQKFFRFLFLKCLPPPHYKGGEEHLICEEAPSFEKSPIQSTEIFPGTKSSSLCDTRHKMRTVDSVFMSMVLGVEAEHSVTWSSKMCKKIPKQSEKICIFW